MNSRRCWLAAILLLSGCGREERTEAVKFCKVLKQGQRDFAAVNAMEKDLLSGTRSWCGAITASGAGRADQLGRNADQAGDLARSASLISTQLGHARQAVYDQVLKKEYPQEIRTTLIQQLTARQRALQELRALLEDSAAGLLELRGNRAYTGDTYPGAVGKLNATLATYKEPRDLVAEALNDLKMRYGITDAELTQ
jgi:hypothetical protein